MGHWIVQWTSWSNIPWPVLGRCNRRSTTLWNVHNTARALISAYLVTADHWMCNQRWLYLALRAINVFMASQISWYFYSPVFSITLKEQVCSPNETCIEFPLRVGKRAMEALTPYVKGKLSRGLHIVTPPMTWSTIWPNRCRFVGRNSG